MRPALVIIPTYNERDNVEAITKAALAADPRIDVLIADDNSPDGTGQLADALAANEPRIQVLHRAKKEGARPRLPARVRVGARARVRVPHRRMDADFSHDPRYPRADVGRGGGGQRPRHRQPLRRRRRGTVNWGPGRKLLSRGGSLYARTILGVDIRDLTAGFICFRRSVLQAIDLNAVKSSGYAFQIELKYRALQGRLSRSKRFPSSSKTACVGQSKMSRKIAHRGPHHGVEAEAQRVRLLEHLVIALPAVFFVVDPPGAVPLFIAMTARDKRAKVLSMARRASIAGALLLIFFAFFGALIFKLFGVTLAPSASPAAFCSC